MAKILLLEDHLTTAQTIHTFLSHKHQVLLAPDLQTAYQKIDTYPFDLVILDRVLPDGDSLELIEYLQDNFPKTRTLILSARTSNLDQLSGYQTGADDYLAKPFTLEMLSLRLNNLLNKDKTPFSHSMNWGKFTYFPNSYQLQFSPHQIITLTPKLAQLFEYLLHRHDTVISREEFVDMHFNRNTSSRRIDVRSVDVSLRRLRHALGKYGHYLQSVHGLGYTLISPKTVPAS